MEKEYIKVNRKAYNEFAKQHNDRFNNIKDNELSDEYWTNLFKEKLLTPNKKNKVLEIGPGSGRMLKLLDINLKCNTTAVDLSEEMIKYSKEKSPNTNYIIDDILNVSFDNNSFDVIIMGALIHNFPKEDAEILLEKVYKWINNNGKILIYTTIHDKSEEGYYEKEDYNGKIIRFRKKYTEKELIDLIKKCKFKIIYEITNEEKDRNKKWINYILEKED